MEETNSFHSDDLPGAPSGVLPAIYGLSKHGVLKCDTMFSLMGCRHTQGGARVLSNKSGVFLLECVLAIGMLGLMLLVVAFTTVQTGRGSVHTRQAYEASCVAQNMLERQLARAVSLVPLGAQPAVNGKLQDDTPYQAVVTCYSLNGAGAATGLTDAEIRGVRVTVTWKDLVGARTTSCEGYVVKLAR